MSGLQMVLITIGTVKYPFKAPIGLYDGDLATACGITIATEADQDLPEYAVKELLQKGLAYRLSATTLTTTGRKSRLKLLVAKDKLQTALDGLNGKSYSITNGGSGTIRSVGFATRVVSRG